MFDVAYYRARAGTHREAALAAAESHIAAIHRDLAERYEAIVRSLDGQAPIHRCEFRPVDGDGAPDGSDLCSGSIKSPAETATPTHTRSGPTLARPRRGSKSATEKGI